MTITAILNILLGVSLRLVVPIGITAMLVYALRRLDERWQSEIEQADTPAPPHLSCYETKDRPPEQMPNRPVPARSQPC
ncbi:MAG: hypothetical protein GXP40_02475 [Chloroflexi bacterium]|nr:hypothetical protein [Chloroflexota bacterium]